MNFTIKLLAFVAWPFLAISMMLFMVFFFAFGWLWIPFAKVVKKPDGGYTIVLKEKSK